MEPLEDRRMLNGLSFADPVFPGALAGLQQFVIGDFIAANAYPDIVGGRNVSSNFNLAVSPANGPASYSGPNYYEASDTSWRAGSDMQVGDFNGDGKLDLSVSFGGDGNNSSEVNVYLGDGMGNFSRTQRLVPGRTVYVHAIGDFNGDGKPDLFLPTYSTVGDLVAYLSTGVGNGTFNNPATIIYGAGVYHPVAGDFNGDGKVDLAAQGVSIWRGDGAGNLTLNQQIQAGTGMLTSGDLNGDGRIDLVSMSSYGTVSVILGKPDGTFADNRFFATGTSGSTKALVIADFDGDGKQDLAFTNAGPYTNDYGVAIRSGDGNGNLLEPVMFSLPSDPWGDLRAADVNNDGKPDLLVGTSNGIAVLINQSTPRSATTSTLVASQNPAAFGQSVTLTATVTSAAGTPSGTVNFMQTALQGEALLGTVALAGNTATFTTSLPSVGNYSFRATYGGNADFAGSVSDTLPLTVNRADTTTTVAAAPNPVMIGQSVTLTATVDLASPGAGTPGGTVTFQDGAATLGTATLTGDTASFSTSSLAVGSHSITAVYDGDANFAGSTGQQTLVVKPVNQAPVLTSAGPMRTTRPQTPVVLSLASVINQGAGTTTIEDSDVGDPVGGIAVVGTTGQGKWTYSLDGATFHDISEPLTASSALLLPAGASLGYTPDGVNAEIAALTFRAWDTFSGNAADTGIDTTSNGGNTGFSEATDTLAVSVQRRVRRHAWVDFGEGNTVVFTGTGPEPQMVQYTDRSAAATETYAYSGQVEILVSPRTPLARVTRFVQALGGTVMTQVPSLGSYLVGVVPGREDAFMTVAYDEGNVRLAIPHEVVDYAASVQLTTLVTAGGAFPVSTQILTGAAARTGPNTFDYIIDDNTNNVIPTNSGGWMTHQEAVTYAESSPDRSPNRDLGLTDATSDPNSTYHLGMGLQIDATIFGSLSRVGTTLAMSVAVENLKTNPDARAVINLSQQAFGGDHEDLNLRLGYALREQEFLAYFAQQLALLDADVLARTTVVLSAGNGYLDAGNNRQGVDLGTFLRGLHAQFKTVFPADGSHRMIVVGATKEDGTVQTAFNHALSNPTDDDGNPTMVYAPGVNVQVAGDGTTAHGTSFAAPVVKAILERAQAARPGAKRDDIVRAFLAASKEKLATHTLPTLQEIWNKLNPTLSIDTEMVTEGSGGGTTGTALFATLSHPTDQDITFTYEERDSSALAGRDYVKTGPKQITIPAGQTAKAIPLLVIADDLYEHDRTFFVDITSVSAKSVSLPSSTLSGWVTIIDDDAAPTITVGSLQVTQPKSGSLVAYFDVTLSAASSEAVTFQYSTVAGTAIPGQDYIEVTSSPLQTIAAGTTQTTVSVTILGELGPQPNQTFTIHLQNVSGATYTDATGFGTCTLINNNSLGAYQLAVAQVVGSGYFGSRVWDDTGQIDTDQGKSVGTYSGSNSGSHWLQTSDAFSSIYNANTGQLLATGTLFFDSSTIPSGLAVRVVYPSYLQAASPTAAEMTLSPAEVLTEAQLPPLVAAAIANWAAAGATAQALDAMKLAQFVVTDLPGASLGLAQASRIHLDRDAAGYGWFIDPTPMLDEEFSPPEPSGQRTAIDLRALDRMDLLTVVAHELGHIAGLPDLDASTSGLMTRVLGTGARREPRQAAIDEVLASNSMWN